MPKLKEQAVERNQAKIEAAALRVFVRRGYHGTSVRDIAQAAGVSLGNLYNYYPTKEKLFTSLIRRYETRMGRLQARLLMPVLGQLDAAALKRLAQAVREIVRRHPDYWRLMYIDVVEFGNRHFAHTFRDLAANLQAMGGQGMPTGMTAGRNGTHRFTVFTAIYLQFFTYYLVESLFGGKQHLGVPEEQAIAQLIEIYTKGIGSDGQTRRSRRQS